MTDQMLRDKWRQSRDENQKHYFCLAPTGSNDGFMTLLESTDNPVSYLEFDQDCNMGGEYIRCYYRLQQDNLTNNGQTIVYRITPFDGLYLRFIEEDGIVSHVTNSSEDSIWRFINQKYHVIKKPYVLIFNLKENSLDSQSVS
jgi:hypothetical protein